MSQLQQIRKDLSHLNVLYVEDEDQVREMTIEFLKKIFLRVDSAVDGQEGLDMFKEDKYDLVITDLKMPRMDGRTMLRNIKELDKDVVLFVMTASDSNIDASTTVCDVYMNKPIQINKFIKALEPIQERLKK